KRKTLTGHSETKNFLILHELDNLQNLIVVAKLKDDRWHTSTVEVPRIGSVSITGIDPDESDDYFMSTADFLTPSSLSLGTIGRSSCEKLKSLPAYFNADGLEISQHEATSKDGTKIPYFQVSRKGTPMSGNNPTLLYGYGGFEISMLPSYNASVG